MNPASNIETRARALFRDACDDIDPATLQRLRLARTAALAAPTSVTRGRRLLLPAGALATAVLALVVAWQPLQAPSVTPANGAAAAASGDNPLPDDDVDLYDNLDFYTWLATQPAVADSGN